MLATYYSNTSERSTTHQQVFLKKTKNISEPVKCSYKSVLEKLLGNDNTHMINSHSALCF